MPVFWIRFIIIWYCFFFLFSNAFSKAKKEQVLAETYNKRFDFDYDFGMVILVEQYIFKN